MSNGTFSISVSNETLARANTALPRIKKAYPQALARALNRTADGMRTDAIRATTERYYAKASDIRKTISFRKATAGNLLGAMVSRGRRRNLTNYKIFPTSPRKGERFIVQAAVKKEGGLKALSRDGKTPTAFLVKRSGGKYFPFYREGYDPEHRQRGKIRSYIAPSIPQILKNEETVQYINDEAINRFSKRLDHEIYYLLGQI